MIIEAVDRVFIMNWVGTHSVSGYVCGIIGDYESNFKQVSIQKTKSGERYIMADRIRFNFEKMKPCEISQEIIEKELAMYHSMKNIFTQLKNDGEYVGHTIDNEEFYIVNLTKYLNERGEFAAPRQYHGSKNG